jgi:hypothetical protein
MKKLLILFILCAAVAGAQPLSRPAWTDSTGKLHAVSAADPLPVGVSSVTITVNPNIPTTLGTSSVVLLSSTPQLISAVAKMRSVTLFATGTFEYGIGSVAATIANRPSVYNVTVPGSYSVSVWTTATGTYLGIDRLGD